MTYRIVRPLFFLALLLVGVGYFLEIISIWWAIPVVFIYSIILIYGAITVHSGFFMEAICTSEKPNQMALTFDDGPDPDRTPTMLKFLKENSIKGAFFIIGEKAKAHPELVKQIVDEGHTVANHTFSHPLTWGFMNQAGLEHQIDQTRDIIQKITGKEPLFFRPPFGVVNPTVVKVIEKLRLHLIGWDIRSRDGGPIKSDAIYKFVKPRIGKGSIALFHDTNTETPAALERILADCKQQGVEIVSLEDLIEKPAYA